MGYSVYSESGRHLAAFDSQGEAVRFARGRVVCDGRSVCIAADGRPVKIVECRCDSNWIWDRYAHVPGEGCWYPEEFGQPFPGYEDLARVS